MAKPIELARVHGAAYHFAFISRDKAEIAYYLNLSERTIYRYSKMKEWHHALDLFGYSGERAFLKRATRDASRDNPDFKLAKEKYRAFYLSGDNQEDIPRRVEHFTGIPATQVRKWAEKHQWFKAFVEANKSN